MPLVMVDVKTRAHNNRLSLGVNPLIEHLPVNLAKGSATLFEWGSAAYKACCPTRVAV